MSTGPVLNRTAPIVDQRERLPLAGGLHTSGPRGSIEHVGGDELLEVPVVPPRDLELLGPPEVQLDVVLER